MTEMTKKFDNPLDVSKNCLGCGDYHEIIVERDDYDLWKRGVLRIQAAFPYLSDDKRELILSGTCGTCYDLLYDEYHDE
jgi:hypothetical protein